PFRNRRIIFLLRYSIIPFSFAMARAVDLAVPLWSYTLLPPLDQCFSCTSLYRKDRSLTSGWFLIRQRRSEFLIIRKEFRLVREITNQESRSQTRLTTNGPAFTQLRPGKHE